MYNAINISKVHIKVNEANEAIAVELNAVQTTIASLAPSSEVREKFNQIEYNISGMNEDITAIATANGETNNQVLALQMETARKSDLAQVSNDINAATQSFMTQINTVLPLLSTKDEFDVALGAISESLLVKAGTANVNESMNALHEEMDKKFTELKEDMSSLHTKVLDRTLPNSTHTVSSEELKIVQSEIGSLQMDLRMKAPLTELQALSSNISQLSIAISDLKSRSKDTDARDDVRANADEVKLLMNTFKEQYAADKELQDKRVMEVIDSVRNELNSNMEVDLKAISEILQTKVDITDIGTFQQRINEALNEIQIVNEEKSKEINDVLDKKFNIADVEVLQTQINAALNQLQTAYESRMLNLEGKLDTKIDISQVTDVFIEQNSRDNLPAFEMLNNQLSQLDTKYNEVTKLYDGLRHEMLKMRDATTTDVDVVSKVPPEMPFISSESRQASRRSSVAGISAFERSSTDADVAGYPLPAPMEHHHQMSSSKSVISTASSVRRREVAASELVGKSVTEKLKLLRQNTKKSAV